MTLDNIISEYIASADARRIIIPDIGAFIKRGNGEIVFMEMLSADDGVLTSEVGRRMALSTGEAAAKVAKYAASIRSVLNGGLAIDIDGLGTISPDEGRLVFIPKPGSAPYFAPSPVEQAKPAKELPDDKIDEEQPDDIQGAGQPDDTQEGRQPDNSREAGRQPETNTGVSKIHINQRPKKRRRADAVMIIAIFAVVAALIALAYGFLVNRNLDNFIN